jgi:CheY-like chemotaxis protein
MLAPAFATAAVEPDPPLPPDTGPLTESALHAIIRARDTAGVIAARVRKALTPPGFVPLRVLVVDDYPDAADTLAVVLELLGCPVRACHDGQTALTVAKEFLPQVCLIDLVMPGMDGLELASRLKVWAAGHPLLLVATTALGDAESKARTALAGFHEHLVKPVDSATLIDTLTRLGKFIARFDPDPPPAPPGATTP